MSKKKAGGDSVPARARDPASRWEEAASLAAKSGRALRMDENGDYWLFEFDLRRNRWVKSKKLSV